MLVHGKDFPAIKHEARSGCLDNQHLVVAIQLNDRTVGELIRFYYSWKKTERFDAFAEKRRKLMIQQMQQQEENRANT